ncbi:phosphoesterase [Spirochaetia bacterium]|nr:phosphoesterase [Spirochaetia bacterium]
MWRNLLDFIDRHESIILTTHENSDADGLGAEIICSRLLRHQQKEFYIFNPGKVAERFAFIDREGLIKIWDGAKAADLPEKSALLVMDASDEYQIGPLREIIHRVREVFAVDHHDTGPLSGISGCIDPTASSTCEIMLEIAQAAGVSIDLDAARAAFAGISYDTGSFAYSKTTARTFRTALFLTEAGVNPNEIHLALNESAPAGALLLQKRVFSTLELHCHGKIAVQILHKEDIDDTGASMEDAESLVNIPLKSRDVWASVMIKENRDGPLRCSIRSRGGLNVARIAREFGGGGHLQAAGFKSAHPIGQTLAQILEKLEQALEKI